jgi:hypothetical protein
MSTDHHTPDGAQAGGLIIASGLFLAVLSSLAFAYALFGPALIVVVVIAVGFGAFGTAHWFLWGRSMSQEDPVEPPV